MNKKGLSQIIATILIILLTVILGGFLASFLTGFAQENLDGSTLCLEYRDYYRFDKEKNNCVQQQPVNGKYKTYIAVKSKTNDVNEDLEIKNDKPQREILGFQVVFTKDNFVEGKSYGDIKRAGNIENKLPYEGDIFVYGVDLDNNYTDGNAKIYIQLKKDNKICESYDEVKLIAC